MRDRVFARSGTNGLCPACQNCRTTAAMAR